MKNDDNDRSAAFDCPPGHPLPPLEPDPDAPIQIGVTVDEIEGRLNVTLWLPKGVTGHGGNPVNLVGFFEATTTRDEFMRDIGAAVVAVAKGEQLP